MIKSLPDWLTGVWYRRSIELDDGTRDTTTQVIWLQTHACFADIRIPADRPPLQSRSSLIELNEDETIALSQQQGFAGVTELHDTTCQWHRYMDYQPFSGVRDIGLLSWDNDLLIEQGVEANYKEEWQRLDHGNGELTALVLPADSGMLDGLSWQGCCVTAGDYFIYMRNRSIALPPAHSLTDLLSQVPFTDRSPYLDCEISFGLCRTGQVPWEIRLSTLPWREGQSLWLPTELTIDPDKGEILHASQLRPQQIDRWLIQEWGTGKAFAID
jgi:hypothetical protein